MVSYIGINERKERSLRFSADVAEAGCGDGGADEPQKAVPGGHVTPPASLTCNTGKGGHSGGQPP